MGNFTHIPRKLKFSRPGKNSVYLYNMVTYRICHPLSNMGWTVVMKYKAKTTWLINSYKSIESEIESSISYWVLLNVTRHHLNTYYQKQVTYYMAHAIINIFPRWLVVNYAMKLGRYDMEHRHGGVQIAAAWWVVRSESQYCNACELWRHFCCWAS